MSGGLLFLFCFVCFFKFRCRGWSMLSRGVTGQHNIPQPQPKQQCPQVLVHSFLVGQLRRYGVHNNFKCWKISEPRKPSSYDTFASMMLVWIINLKTRSSTLRIIGPMHASLQCVLTISLCLYLLGH